MSWMIKREVDTDQLIIWVGDFINKINNIKLKVLGVNQRKISKVYRRL